jgi:NAD(P)-dependent dehydrogenase (short-subunit alcohol dehydrogenase family)
VAFTETAAQLNIHELVELVVTAQLVGIERDGDGRRDARELTPDDTAAIVAMLARDDAEALTGQTLTADGGLVMR